VKKISVTDLDFGEVVIVEIIDNSEKLNAFNEKVPKSLLGKTLMMERTGSHTLQPLYYINGWKHNIMDAHIKRIWRYRGFEEEKDRFLKKEKEIQPIIDCNRKVWHIGGKIGRENYLPAIEYINDDEKEWYKDGRPLTKEEMVKVYKKIPEYFI